MNYNVRGNDNVYIIFILIFNENNFVGYVPNKDVSSVEYDV